MLPLVFCLTDSRSAATSLQSPLIFRTSSPIRRYPDLFIHRVISKYLDNGYNVDEETLAELQRRAVRYADLSSEAERNAVKAEREAEDIKKAEFMEDKIGEEYEGVVSSVTNFGIFVELESTVEGLVRFENMGKDYFTYDEQKRMLIGEITKKTYKIGDTVKIRVIEANKLLRRISFELVLDENEKEMLESDQEFWDEVKK